MIESDQYKISITGQEAEDIIKNHMTNLLKEKGYELDYSFKEPGDFYPDSSWRGVKEPKGES